MYEVSFFLAAAAVSAAVAQPPSLTDIRQLNAWGAKRGGVLVARWQAVDFSNHAAALRLRSDFRHERRWQRSAPGVHRQRSDHVRVFPAGQQTIVYGSTHLAGDACPKPPDRSKGYLWGVFAGYDIFSPPTGQDRKAPDGSAGLRCGGHGELQNRAHRLHFARVGRSGSVDNEADGRQEADHQGRWATMAARCFRAMESSWCGAPGIQKCRRPAKYKELLAENLTAPMKMELIVSNADGSRQNDHEFRMCEFCADVYSRWKEDSVRLE